MFGQVWLWERLSKTCLVTGFKSSCEDSVHVLGPLLRNWHGIPVAPVYGGAGRILSTVRQLLVERRKLATEPLIVSNRGILVHFAGCDGVPGCCVRDVANLGAGIRLNA
jgi:hypothetical protein